MTEALQTIRRTPALVDHESYLRTTSLCFALGHGARHDPHGAAGTTHMLEHLLMSAPLADGISVAQHIERLGGSCNATTGPESLVVHAQVLDQDAERIIELLGEALLRPRLSQECLDSERRVVLQELTAAATDPADAVQDAFLARLFATHPLASPVGGLAETVSGIGLADVQDAYTRALALAPRTVAVVGGLSKDRVMTALAGSGLLDIPSAATEPPEDAAPGPVAPGTDEAWPDEFCWMMVGGRAPRARDPRRLTYTVLAHLLGSSPASLLYARFRGQEALAYYFSSWSRTYTDSGAWRMLAGCEPGNAPRLLSAFREVLHCVAAGSTAPGDFAAAVHQAVVEKVLDAESPLNRAIRLASRGILADDRWDPEHDIAALRQVTPDQVAEAAAELAAGLVSVVRPERS
ncbi:M16 family metallopeptidase [Nocardia sp.]|uniref:M16 family metallopeptidase n=1 Tax=Nocardia sp. TaxID=1821 RepID=UPI00261DC49F|nr:pitrilysin family protein [Nocardia sp.]